MMRLVNIVAILGIVLPMFASCKTISDFLDKGEVVARVGEAKLMMEELQRVIPNGISPEDSSLFAKQYIGTWALDHVYMEVAEQQLSAAELDVSQELEAYRRSLLKYRYEQLYVNQRLDTLVSEEQVREFYEKNTDRFILKQPIVKARFMTVMNDLPNLKTIKKKMSSSKVDDMMEADSLATMSALKYISWNDAWVDAIVLAKEFGPDAPSVMSSIRKGWIEKKESKDVKNIAYISEVIPAGKKAPREYCAQLIKDMIISARKQELISNLEQDLLKDARESGKFEILK
jgi:hypothetical protein